MTHIQGIQETPLFESPHGEIVRELGGLSAGGLQQHSIAHITLPPGKASLKHYHPVIEESYFILNGIARMEIDGQTYQITPGQMVAILPTQVHQIFNDNSTDPVSFIAVCTPPWTPDCSVFLD